MIHGFTCTGLTQTQYVNHSKVTNIGYVEDKYISTGKCTMCRMFYSSLGYKNAVGACYEEKLSEERREAQQDCNYATDRDVIITDARHDSSRAA
ncbi:unnamed protein product [Porites evermanni]|uniref:Uncharacterized protein n=1 Tax=Porites evermanni TaxID=104178 RepID=A0ABN8PE45_9CNID|nr:unnamed protein product [Porites evermanni]